MRVHRVIALFTLVAFIPYAAGCSTTVSRAIENDPGDTVAPGDPVPIIAYTDGRGVRHDWDGFIEATGADSLLFTRPAPEKYQWGYRAPADTVQLRLSREDVVSVEVEREDVLGSTFAVWWVAIGAMVLFAIVLGATRTGDAES